MSHEAVLSAPLSRPKIHRPPSFSPKASKIPPSVTVILPILLAAIIAAVMVSKLINRYNSEELALIVPVTQMQPVMPAVSDEVQPSGTIVIKGQEGTIVGQMAKVPVQSSKIGEIKTVSHVDNGGSRDLLSIVGKY